MPPKHAKTEVDQIAQATVALLEPKFQSLEQLIADCAKKTDLSKVKNNVLLNHYKLDNLEQYQKRENLRIHNFSPSGDVTDAVVILLNHMVMLKADVHDEPVSAVEPQDATEGPFSRKDISACHFTNPSPGKKRQVIVRFVSRESIRLIYRHKKKLRNSPNPEYKRVFITDDVTVLKLKMKVVIGKIPGVEKVFIRDGNIHCMYRQKHYKLMSPDDIFDQLKVEITTDMLRELGLGDYV